MVLVNPSADVSAGQKAKDGFISISLRLEALNRFYPL
jgi:hypothetical protein